MHVIQQPDSDYSVSSGRRLLRDTLSKRWKLLALSIFLLIGVSAFTAALAASTRLIVNDVFVAENTDAAIRVAMIVIGVSLGKGVFQYGNTVAQILLTRSVSVEMQNVYLSVYVVTMMSPILLEDMRRI